MKIVKKNIFLIYSVLISIVGLFVVPLRSIYDGKVVYYKYGPIWTLMNNKMSINRQTLYYVLDVPRLVITLIVITICAFSLYLYMNDKERIM